MNLSHPPSLSLDCPGQFDVFPLDLGHSAKAVNGSVFFCTYVFSYLLILNFCMFLIYHTHQLSLSLDSLGQFEVFPLDSSHSAKAINGGDWVEACIFVIMYFFVCLNLSHPLSLSLDCLGQFDVFSLDFSHSQPTLLMGVTRLKLVGLRP